MELALATEVAIEEYILIKFSCVTTNNNMNRVTRSRTIRGALKLVFEIMLISN